MSNQGGIFNCLKVILILALVGAGFFCGQKVWAADIIINEIQVYPAENRFIELYNASTSAFNLTGWSVKKKTSSGKEYLLLASNRFEGKSILPKSYFLLASEDGYIGSLNPDATWAKSNTVAKDNTIILYDNNQVVVDRVGFGLSADCETVCALNPDEDKSIQRNIFVDTNNNNDDFLIQNSPSPLNSSTQASPQPSPLPGGGDDAPLPGETANPTEEVLPELTDEVKFGEVVINEFVVDPADNEVEWVEIFNKCGDAVDLSGWRLEDGSKAKTNLSGSLAGSGAGRFKVIEKPAGNLNNAGDLIVLYDNAGKIIDQVAYGNWDDGDVADNAPAAGDPNSTARKYDGYNTYNNANDFAVTEKITRGSSNIIESHVESETSQAAKAGFDFSNDIYLTEFLPNPVGDDTKLEFIEIFNAGGRDVNLTGWSLSNEDGKKVYLEKMATSTIVKAGEYLAIFRPRSKIVLHNDRGEVRLYQPLAEKPFRAVEYEKVKEGWSYNFEPANKNWQWSEIMSPGAVNVIKAVNHAPEVDFNLPEKILVGAPVIFDSSDTADADDDKLIFNWDFGDGLKNSLANPEHTYFKTGVYQVKLAVSDGQATSTKEKNVVVAGEGMRAETPLTTLGKGGDIIINELFPDAEGADAGKEWLELKNTGAGKINLLNWRVENGNGKFKFKNDLWLDADGYYVLKDAESKLALKNGADAVSLYDDTGNLVDRVEYADIAPTQSYARGANEKWFWTDQPTPGAENVISLAGGGTVLGYKAMASAGSYSEVPLEEVKNLAVGSLITTRGLAAVEPGILGAQIFYLINASGTPAAGLQIYNYKKDFPVLATGDEIEVKGELAQAQGEVRLKTKDKADITVKGHGSAPLPLAVNCEMVSEEMLGQLITVSGEITDKNSSSLYVDDGTDEILVYLKQAAGVDAKNLAAGQKLTVTGILGRTAAGLRLLPRGQFDVAPAGAAQGLEPQVLGEVAAADEWEIAARDKKLELFKYLIILAFGGIIILAVLLIRLKKKAD